MRNSQKIILTLGIACLLASCGGTSSETTESTSDPTSGSVSDSTSGTTAESTGGSSVTEIVTVWVHKNETEDEGKIYKQLVTNFNAGGYTTASGANVRMSMSFYGDTLEDKINASIITGGLPDIIAVDSSDVAAKVYSEIIVPIDDYIDSDTKATFVNSVISAGTIDDKLYSLSPMEAPGGLYYNKEMLLAAGYTEEDFGTLENRWSFKDVHNAQIALKNAGQPYQIALNQGFGTDGNMYLYSGLVYGAGATFGSDDHVTEALTTDAAVDGIAQLELFYDKTGLADGESWVYNGTSDIAFTSGEIPFQIHGPWDARTLKKSSGTLKDNYGIMPYPCYEDENGNKKTDVFSSPCGSYGFAITKDSNKLDAATVALLYLCGAEAGEMLYNGIGTFPTNVELLSSLEDLQSGPEKDLADYLTANEFTRPKQAKYPRLKDAYGEVLDYIKNMNLVSSYDLKGQIEKQMKIVDSARP